MIHQFFTYRSLQVAAVIVVLMMTLEIIVAERYLVVSRASFIYSLCCLAVLLIMFRKPVVSSWLIISLFIVSLSSPILIDIVNMILQRWDTHASAITPPLSISLALSLALAFLAYHNHHQLIWSLIIIALAFVSFSIHQQILTTPIYAVAILLIIFIAICCILWGTLIRLREQRDTALQREHNVRQSLEHTIRRTSIANTLHDHVANDLSCALILMQQQSFPSSESIIHTDDSQVRNNELLGQLIRDALSYTHTIISILDEADIDAKEPKSPPTHAEEIMLNDYCRRLQHELQNSETLLSSAGHTGESLLVNRVTSEIHIATSLQDCIDHIIQELTGNIIKHADRHAGYDMVITLHNDRCHIMQTNAIPQNESIDRTHIPSLGTGLSRIKQLVESHSGSFVARIDSTNGLPEWSCSIIIPYHPATTNGEKSR